MDSFSPHDGDPCRSDECIAKNTQAKHALKHLSQTYSKWF